MPGFEMPLTVALVMWFRVLVKMISSNSYPSYKWHEMTFCFYWENEHCSILCLGVDDLFQSLLQDILYRDWPTFPSSDPCCLLVPLIETVIAMYDRSVWSIRDVTREAEKASAVH